MSLELIEVSGLVTIQDSGRAGWMRFGVPSSGPMDRFAFQASNALAGNPPDSAVIEVGLGDAVFRASRDCVVAVAGIGFDLSVYIWDFPLWSSFFVRSGWTIRLSKKDSGMWAYLAIAGGIQTPPMLGSRSTYLRGAFGGLEGRRLQAGDRLQTGNPTRALDDLAARTLPAQALPSYGEDVVLEVIMGPQEKYFTSEATEAFMSGEYSVSLTSDRMGYRLEGPELTHRGNTELISEGLAMGAIQVPAIGQPIVMMADCPTTGGYPKIATIASADLPVLAQCAPNRSTIRFRETTVANAQKRYRALMSGIEDYILGQGE